MSNSLNRRLRRFTDQAARLCGVLSRREQATARDLTVLMYHRVLPDERCADYPFPSLAMPLSAFREQVRWLAAHGEVLPLVDALERVVIPEPSARRLFAVTIDDGYGDAAEFAATVLEEAGARGTFFVTTGFVGTRELLWFDRAALLVSNVDRRELREIRHRFDPTSKIDDDSTVSSWIAFLKHCRAATRRSILSVLESAARRVPSVAGYEAMSIEQVADLHARGHEIGSHTVSHALLPELDDDSLLGEIEGARDSLARWLNVEIPGFCYPNGDCDDRVAQAVSRAGHSYACTTRDGLHRRGDDLFRIRRVDVVPERALDDTRRFDETAFRRELCGLYRRREGEHS